MELWRAYTNDNARVRCFSGFELWSVAKPGVSSCLFQTKTKVGRRQVHTSRLNIGLTVECHSALGVHLASYPDDTCTRCQLRKRVCFQRRRKKHGMYIPGELRAGGRGPGESAVPEPGPHRQGEIRPAHASCFDSSRCACPPPGRSLSPTSCGSVTPGTLRVWCRVCCSKAQNRSSTSRVLSVVATTPTNLAEIRSCPL